MKKSTCLALVSLIQGIVAYPSAKRLYVRDCEPGSLVCHSETQVGLCNTDKTVIFFAVADGTRCTCQGSECGVFDDNNYNQNSQAPAPQPAPASTDAPQPNSQLAFVESTSPIRQEIEIPVYSIESAPVTQQTKAAFSPPSAPSAPSLGDTLKAVPTETLSTTPSQTSASESDLSHGGGVGVGVDIGGGRGYVKTFLGNGAASAGWPARSDWASFDSMWRANMEGVVSKSCTAFGQEQNSESESADLKSAVEEVARSSGVDARFILAVALQESGGCVRAPTTDYGVRNPGLMQSHNGAHSCYGLSPCPSEQIKGMIQDGTEGTPDGDGLKQLLEKAGKEGGGEEEERFYRAARMYNSGSVASSGQLQDGIATHCYASDIANRLIGWSEGIGNCKMN